VENEDRLDEARALFLSFESEDMDVVPLPPPIPKLRRSPRKEKAITLHQVSFATKLLIFICIVVFGLSNLDQNVIKWFLFEVPVHHPYWEGIYNQLLSHHFWAAPLFVQIREGQVWRLITPIFLHANLLHILFNMLWLWSLGKPVEERLGIPRYLLLMGMVGLGSNVAQYLMSGPLFMGYSGVIAGLAGFIYVRQKEAPWEGYPIHPSTFIFLAIFIFGLAILQAVAFFIAFFGWANLNISIANTAHIVGALMGMALAKLKVFR
jgi:membrane associated rhomboid family serine protease